MPKDHNISKAKIIYDIEKDVFSTNQTKQIKETQLSDCHKPYCLNDIYYALQDKNKLFYLLEDKQLNVAVGYAALIITPDYNDIFSLAIKRNFQKLGYGKKLLQWIAEKSNGKKVFLEVYTENIPAVNLYKSGGYKIIDKRKNYFGQDKDAFIMMKKF
ncbi:MAG: GNAT family N-acetyltransferase [Bifidobacteriaceae bacterium]|jgi:ribosomal-protein-alanine N-acetyltransferase|nr:GNAT family N-acetyltransferase [Bifidobacteriaceae bacterium]